jgi:hypothetical protein
MVVADELQGVCNALDEVVLLDDRVHGFYAVS